MDAISLIIRPMPPTSASTGGAPTAKSSASSSRPDDAPAFAPADQASSQHATDKPSATKEPKPAQGKDDTKPAEATSETKPTEATEETKPHATSPQDQNAVADQIATATANGDALLIAQAAASATPNTPIAMPVVAPVIVATPQENPTAGKQSDATAAIAAVGSKAKQAAATTTPATTPTPATVATSAGASTESPAQPDAAARQAATAAASGAPQPQAGEETIAALATKPNALDALLDGAKSPATQSAAPATQTQPTGQPNAAQSNAAQLSTGQPSATQTPPTGQVAPAVSAETEPKPLTVDRKTEVDAAAATRSAHSAAPDAANTPAVSFGTDPGASAHVKSATAAYETARAATPILPASEQVAMQIHRAVGDGIDKVTVELKPAALGRVSAEIEFHDDHRVHVVLSADRPATLDALRSDARALERALQDAGLRADAGSLSFRFENGGGQPGFTPDGSADGVAIPAASVARDAVPLPATAYASFTRPGGVDIHV